MGPFIVGFTGPAKSGKDTAGAALVKHLGFVRYSWADPLKQGLAAMFGWDVERLMNNNPWRELPIMINGEPVLPSPRVMMQTLGTEWGRKVIDKDMWVKLLAYRVEAEKPKRVVITDVRFDNEAKWIQQQGGWVIEIHRPGIAPVAEHSSEDGISHRLIDFTIGNNFKTTAGFKTEVVSQIKNKLLASGLL